MEYDASGYPIGCNPPPVLKIQVNAGKKINEKLSGFYISVSKKCKTILKSQFGGHFRRLEACLSQKLA